MLMTLLRPLGLTLLAVWSEGGLQLEWVLANHFNADLENRPRGLWISPQQAHRQPVSQVKRDVLILVNYYALIHYH
jgi:uncharacterized protein YpiB (UPF0302 family)